MTQDPLNRPKESYRAIIDRIKAQTDVGIDVQYTHAVIIDYLKGLDERIARLEKFLEEKS